MTKDFTQHNEAGRGLFKIANDPRITRVGSWIRRTHLGELPQLWNVVRGKMSFVGRGSLIEEEDALLAGRDRHPPAPDTGIAGPWQVRGPMTTPLSERW
jgi:lipopolysaccharide/colanic/teichoic acid biosynthesis glycosyltransferase